MSNHIQTRKCRKCGTTRFLSEFPIYKQSTGGRRHECRFCYRARMNAQYIKDPETKKLASARRYAAKPYREWDDEAKQLQRERHRAYRAEHLAMVLNHYGARCACCGETEPIFLTVDHVRGNGAAHRREIKAGRSVDNLYRWIIKNGFPDDFQVLCFNCNCGRYRNGGQCPHTTEGSTTIAQASTPQARWKRPAPERGEEIVCSYE